MWHRDGDWGGGELPQYVPKKVEEFQSQGMGGLLLGAD